MYEFPDLIRWFDIVDYTEDTEFNSCKILFSADEKVSSVFSTS